MAKQTINIGASPNDGTGTPLRTAFDYTNQNFTELYAALGGGTGLPGATNQVLFNNGTAIAGDAGMTYNPSTDTMTLANLVLNGTFAARNGDTPSAIRAAASDYAAVAFDGATSGTRIVSTLTSQNIGTGDMSMWNRFRVFTTTGTTRYIASLSSSSTTADQASACLLYISSIGGLVFYLYGATVTDFRYATIAGFQTLYSGQVVDIVVTRTGSTLKIYINGTDTAYAESTGGTPPAWSATITSTNLFIGQSTGTSSIFTSRIYRSVVFNRALSATDVTELITVGVNPADQWGTQTAAYTSDFSVNADSWAQNIGNPLLTATGNIDGISGVDDTLRFANTDTVSVALQVRRNSTLVTTKRYRISFDYFAETGSGLQFLGLGFFGTRYDAGSSAVVENAWQTGVSLEAVIPLTLLPVASFTTSTGTSTSAFAASKNVYFKNFVVTRIGAIVDLDFTVGGGTTAFDRSTNGLDGTLFGGVSWTMPREGQYINGPSTITGALGAAGLNVTGATIPANGVYLGSANNLSFSAASTLGMTLNSTGLGIGVVPSAWTAGFKAFQVGVGSALWTNNTVTRTSLTTNFYYNGGDLFIGNGYAHGYWQDGANGHRWFTSSVANASGAGASATMNQSMTLDASGNLLVGTTSQNGSWNTKLTISNDSGTTKWAVGPYLGGVTNFLISAGASAGVYLNGTAATSWTSASDERLKDIIEPISNAVSKVASLRAVIGKFKFDENNTRKPFLIAQDIQAVLPEAVDASNPDKLGVAYTEVIPLLVAAIKELSAEVNALKNA
jgi:hypothetical protein